MQVKTLCRELQKKPFYTKRRTSIEKKDKFQKDGQVYRKDRTLKKPIPKTAHFVNSRSKRYQQRAHSMQPPISFYFFVFQIDRGVDVKVFFLASTS